MALAHDLLPMLRRQLRFIFDRCYSPGFADDHAAIAAVREAAEMLHQCLILMDESVEFAGPPAPDLPSSLRVIDGEVV